MKKKIIKITLIIISMFLININVYAANAGTSDTSTTLYSELKSNYEKNKSSLGITKISGSGMVTLYGYSSCNGTSCSINYMGVSSKPEEALARSVVCSNGEGYINYQNTGTGGATDYMEDNKAKLNGDAYWSVDYSVTCSSSGTKLVSNDSSSGNNNTQTTTNVTNDVTTKTDYSTSTTTNNENTGVNTYFIVLGLVAVISYIFMLCVKKYNLFKNI